jgi:hypothetical protein
MRSRYRLSFGGDMADKWTHYRVLESFGEDDEHERGEPFPSQEEAVRYGESLGMPFWSVYPCRQVPGPKGLWWHTASSYSYSSW